MSNVVKLGFPEIVKIVGVRLFCLPEFGADQNSIAWYRRDPNHKESIDWLDTNAPGWSTIVQARYACSLDLPIGVDTEGTFLFHEVRVIFDTARHRELWRAHVKALKDDREAMRQRVMREAIASGRPGIKICDECASHLEPIERVDTYRVAQFALVIKAMALRCEPCGETTYTRGEDFNRLDEAMGRICKLVGLPDDADPYPTKPRSAEWNRRRDAPPVVTIHIEPGTSADEIIRLLEEQLASLTTPNGIMSLSPVEK